MTEPLTLTPGQAEAIAAVDAAMAAIAEGFEEFVVAANRCEQADVPLPILQGKAMEMQQLVLRQMTGG